MLKELFLKGHAKVREINKRYEKPGIEMSGPVKASLLFLRVYLMSLIGLSIYKFITMVR